MPAERRKLIALGVLLVGLGIVVYYGWWSQAQPATASSNGSTSGATAPRSTSIAPAPDVHLPSLSAPHPKPESDGRNLFREKPKPLPPPPPPPRTAPVVVAPTGPPPPAPPPPIPLKFIGIVEATERKAKIAVLSDGRSQPVYGAEGQTVLGMYRILHIGVESIEMSYLDGRGRQTIRLTGS